MRIEVDKDVLKKTGKCLYDFKCLESSDFICKIEREIKNEVFFISKSEPKYCSYDHNFGHAVLCSCPVRGFIYNKYKV